MMFKSLAVLSMLGLAAAAPAEKREFTATSADGAAALGICGGEATNSYDNGILPYKIQAFCQGANSGKGTYSDIGDNYHLRIEDSQGGSYEPCWRAFSWVYKNCALQGKVGLYATNANVYSFDHY